MKDIQGQMIARLFMFRREGPDGVIACDSRLEGSCDCPGCIHNYAVILQTAVHELCDANNLDIAEIQRDAQLASMPTTGRPN